MVVPLLHPLWLLPWAPHRYSINVQMGIVSPVAAPVQFHMVPFPSN